MGSSGAASQFSRITNSTKPSSLYKAMRTGAFGVPPRIHTRQQRFYQPPAQRSPIALENNRASARNARSYAPW